MRERWLVVAVTVLAFLAVRVAYTVSADNIGEGMAHLESQTGVVLPDWYADHPWMAAGLLGDGLIFVTQTVDPWGLEGHADRIATAVFRFQRIGYPLAAVVVTGGSPSLAPIGLFVVSLIGVGMAAWAAAALRERVGPRAWLLVANPAVVLGLVSGTAEPFGMGLLAFALVGSGRWVLPLAAVRPSLLVAMAHRPRWLVAGGAVFAGLRFVALGLFDRPAVEGSHNFASPLVDYFSYRSSVWVLAGLAVAVLLWGVRSRNWAWVLSGLVVLCFADPVLEDPVNAWRSSGMLWAVLATGHGRSDRPTLTKCRNGVTPWDRRETM